MHTVHVSIQIPASLISSMMLCTYSVSSVTGLVSSNRRLVYPGYFLVRPKLRQMADGMTNMQVAIGFGGNLRYYRLVLSCLKIFFNYFF